MKRLVQLAFVLSVLFFAATSFAQPQFFLGSAGGSGISSAGILPTAGLQFGSYNFADSIGGRVALEATPSLDFALFQFLADGLYVSGDTIKFYAGPGLGLVTAPGLTNAFILGTIGVDFDAHTTVSYFLEAQPRYYLGGQPILYIRSGVNVHF